MKNLILLILSLFLLTSCEKNDCKVCTYNSKVPTRTECDTVDIGEICGAQLDSIENGYNIIEHLDPELFPSGVIIILSDYYYDCE